MLLRITPLVLLLALAPVQCTKKWDPSMAREETAGDGLWSLAEDFRAKGNEKGYVDTLRFLVTRYPSSRRAPAAREELEKRGEKVPSPSEAAPAASATSAAGAK
jgi:hypothetical protein